MSSPTPNNDVQQELEGISPLLARLREQKANESASSVDMDTLHALGDAALLAVPLEESDPMASVPTMKVVYRKRKWVGLVAAAAAMMVGALLSYSIFTDIDGSSTELAGTSATLTEELIASYEAQTADPIAFLLDDEMLFTEDEDLFFSPAEDVLLDWADDGTVDEALSEEVMLDALW